MRLATIRHAGGTAAVRIDESSAVEIGLPDVGALLAHSDWARLAAEADGTRHDVANLDYAPVVPRPPKIICVGRNYHDHIGETGAQVPTHPTLFAKFPAALVGAYDDIMLSTAATTWDWEAELALVIGAPAYRVDAANARAAIAGYTVANDISARDWQQRTVEWLQGKTFASTTPLGPELVTLDEAGEAHQISCEVSGEVMQDASTADLIFHPDTLVSYISTILPLEAGDVILTGTPGGVGFTRKPPRLLTEGDKVITRITGVGECRNTCRQH
jgi:acylpyruvate hydrolase